VGCEWRMAKGGQRLANGGDEHREWRLANGGDEHRDWRMATSSRSAERGFKGAFSRSSSLSRLGSRASIPPNRALHA